MKSRQWCPVTRAAAILGDPWSLLVLRELCFGPQRFKTLKKNIPSISMDQLTRKLDYLCKNHVIVRQEFSEIPPRVEYEFTEWGGTLIPVLKRIFLWGGQNAWGRPKSDESVDLALTLRLMAGFSGRGEGTLNIFFESESGTQVFHLRRSANGNVTVDEAPSREAAPVANAFFRIQKKDWVRCLAQLGEGKVVKVPGGAGGKTEVLKNLLPIFNQIVLDRPTHHQSHNSQRHQNAIDGESPVGLSL